MSSCSAFEVLGPIMIGPSSSHTAGALRIAQLARSLMKHDIASVEFVLYNSFASTHKGHGTDRALLGGILGFEADNPLIKNSFEEAQKANVKYTFTISDRHEGLHPNTADIIMTDVCGNTTSVRGESLGGGRIALSRLNGVPVVLTGEYSTFFVTHQDVCGVLGHITSVFGKRCINIAFMRTFRDEKGGHAYTVFETDEPVDDALIKDVEACEHVQSAMVINLPGSIPLSGLYLSDDFISGKELLELCHARNKSIGQIMWNRENQLSGDDVARSGMERVLRVMRDEVSAPLHEPEKSMGGLIGGEAAHVYGLTDTSSDEMKARRMKVAGEVLTRASAYGMAVLERSAAMGLIVAAPTAGASGVVPAAVLATAEALELDDDKILEALYTASAVGYLIMRNATVAGAEGGCQAEVGSASAMAAAALVEMMGGTPEQALHAASIALSNLLGLVCDPIGGLVEAPCQMRNAQGASTAITAANLALAQVPSIIPFDEVVETMLRVGRQLPCALRETAQGGLAITPTACERCATMKVK